MDNNTYKPDEMKVTEFESEDVITASKEPIEIN